MNQKKLKEMQKRKDILSKHNGDYKLYKTKENKSIPLITIVLNNFTTFYEMYGNKYDDLLNSMTRECVKYRVIFIITANVSGDIRYRLKQNFKQFITLQHNKDEEYTNVFEKAKKIRPSAFFGRGLISIKDAVFEFQTAKLCNGEDYNNYVLNTIEEVKNRQENKVSAIHIPVLPEIVTFEQVKDEVESISAIPLGVSKNEIEIYKYDFKKNFLTIMTGNDIEELNLYISNLLEEMQNIQNLECTIIDAENLSGKINNNVIEQYQTFIDKFSMDKNETNHSLCIVIGIDKFMQLLGLDKDKFNKYLQEMKQSRNYSFIILDTATKIKNHAYDDWYRNFTTNDTGIWIGNGFGEQYLLKSSINRRDIIDNCGKSFGYVINKGDCSMIKLLEMRDKENE